MVAIKNDRPIGGKVLCSYDLDGAVEDSKAVAEIGAKELVEPETTDHMIGQNVNKMIGLS
jgi:hypothetical protein